MVPDAVPLSSGLAIATYSPLLLVMVMVCPTVRLACAWVLKPKGPPIGPPLPCTTTIPPGPPPCLQTDPGGAFMEPVVADVEDVAVEEPVDVVVVFVVGACADAGKMKAE